jgi:ribonuclease-3
LTRPAYALEQAQIGQTCEDQEAFSLLGSAVLDAVLTELLIRAGYTTQQDIVTQKIDLKQVETLAQISQAIGLGEGINLGAAEKQQGTGQLDSLAETLEAVIGGIYFDGGFSAARQTIQNLYKDRLGNEWH